MIFLKIKTEERKETADIPAYYILAKAFLNGLNMLVNKFTYLFPLENPLGGGVYLEQTDVTH
jgi:hypothetical protein